MKFSLSAFACTLSLLAAFANPALAADNQPVILAELFTSEGCSSCPPADKFLETLDSQPIKGVHVIVMSEHVDYWNHDGWKDPYSSHLFTERQEAYNDRLKPPNGSYTPQMILNGIEQFTGSDTDQAGKSFTKVVQDPKVPLHLSNVSIDASHVLHAHVDSGPLDPSFHVNDADLMIAVAMNRAESQVSAGENKDRKLTHVAVVRSLNKDGQLKQGQSVNQDIQVKVDPKLDADNLRIIAFLQEAHQGRVVGAAEAPLGVK
ncbi:MAG TPA: DUF1223 domain-containing protein [Terriglobales bacterium]